MYFNELQLNLDLQVNLQPKVAAMSH